MKIFAIRDGSKAERTAVAFLLYSKREQQFFIELPDSADPWETPLLLSSFAEKGQLTIGPYWSLQWVRQRIVPSDRQNIGQILRDNGLETYDEYSLLMLNKGRCSQDNYYLEPVSNGKIPETIRQRFQERIQDVVPLSDFTLLAFFHNGVVRKIDLKKHFMDNKKFAILLKRSELFPAVRIHPGGYGAYWDINLDIPYRDLYQMGQAVPLSGSDFRSIVSHRIVDASEAASMRGCSRQNIADLTRKGKLSPIKRSGKATLYLKSDILSCD